MLVPFEGGSMNGKEIDIEGEVYYVRVPLVAQNNFVCADVPLVNELDIQFKMETYRVVPYLDGYKAVYEETR